MDAGEGPWRSRVPWLPALCILAGLAVRFALCFEKPLWADEIFTLSLAREPLSRIVEALRLDSGPPLHYFLAKLALLPFGAPGPGDVSVRLVSFVAALLHVPLILVAARRTGAAQSGWCAAALYALFPIAVSYGAEGRGYAVASLLVLAAFERSLAVRDTPSPATAVVAGLCAAGAVLTHYLAIFPLAGLALVLCRRRPWRLHVLSGGVAALVAAPWLLVGLAQPRASMAWVAGLPPAGKVPRLVADLLLGIDDGGGASPFLFSGAVVVLVLFVLAARRGNRAAGTVLAGGALFFLAGLAFPEILLPERGAVAFLPLTALVLAGCGSVPARTAACAAGAFLLLQAPSWVRTSQGEDLAAHVAASVGHGARVVTVGLWGPELAYRMAAIGRPGSVAFFPSDVSRHPGWYAEAEVPAERMAAEARALVARCRPVDLFVLPRGSRASEVLRAEIVSTGAERVGATTFLEIYRAGRSGPDGRPAK